ncbi:MAG: hypothetical protein RLZZ306_2624 [Bacteroidota bacterium]|jgi:hypothetical protein
MEIFLNELEDLRGGIIQNVTTEYGNGMNIKAVRVTVKPFMKFCNEKIVIISFLDVSNYNFNYDNKTYLKLVGEIGFIENEDNYEIDFFPNTTKELEELIIEPVFFKITFQNFEFHHARI